MGIFKRVKHMATADTNHFLDKMENPVSMVKQYIRDLEEQMGQAQQALAQQYWNERRYEAQIEETTALIMKRSRQAELAVDRQEDAIAELAIEEKLYNQEKLALYKTQHEAAKKQTAALLEQMKRMNEKYNELVLQKQNLLSRIRAAQAIQASTAALQPYDMDRVHHGLARIEEKVWQVEAQAYAGIKAGEVLNAAPSYAEQEKRDAIQMELAALKEKRGSA